MKKILILSGTQVFPPQSGGQLRTAALAEALVSVGYTVTLFSLTGRKSEYQKLIPSSKETPLPGLIEYIERGWANALLQLLTYRLGLPDLWIQFAFWNHGKLKDLKKSHEVWLADFPFTTGLLKGNGDILRVLNAHNLEFERHKGLLRFLT